MLIDEGEGIDRFSEEVETTERGRMHDVRNAGTDFVV